MTQTSIKKGVIGETLSKLVTVLEGTLSDHFRPCQTRKPSASPSVAGRHPFF